MTEADYELYAGLDPEALKQLLGLGTLDDRGALLQQQMGQAQQFTQPVGKNYGTVGGNIAGGLGDIARQFIGGRQVAGLQGQQTGLLDQRDAGRGAYADAMLKALQARFGQRPVAPQSPNIPPLLRRPDTNAPPPPPPYSFGG